MKRICRPRLGFPLLLLLLSGACTGQAPGSGWAGTVDTLSNGAVRVVNPAQGIWEQGQPWRLVPDLEIGEIEGADAEVFASVSGLEVDAEGRVYVLDRQTNELRIFSPDGTHIRSVGGTGGGPGEYAAANGLKWFTDDTLLVIDQRGGRYSLLTKEGEFARSVPRHLTFYGWSFRGGLWEGRVYEVFSVQVGEERYPALLGTLLGDAFDDRAQESLPQPEASPSGAFTPVDTVMLPMPEAPAYEGFSVRNERGGMNMGVPFTPSSVYHLDSSGQVWHGHGGEFRIFRSSMAGDTLQEIVLEGAPAPVTPEELAEWEAGPYVEQFRAMGGDLDMGRIPKVKPFFEEIYLDPDGYTWLSVPAGPAEMEFALLDPDGRYLGRLSAGVRRDVYLPPIVRDGRLYVVGRDELDVQHVYGFRIVR